MNALLFGAASALLDKKSKSTCNPESYCVKYLPALRRNVCGQVAQLVEQRTENPRAEGSSPPLTTMNFTGQEHSFLTFFVLKGVFLN